jgi:hypothetical protein
LSLQSLDTSGFVPQWPSFKVLELRNVQLGIESIRFLKTFKVHACFTDMIWRDNGIGGVVPGSEFLQVVISGVQVVEAPRPFRATTGQRAPPKAKPE